MGLIWFVCLRKKTSILFYIMYLNINKVNAEFELNHVTYLHGLSKLRIMYCVIMSFLIIKITIWIWWASSLYFVLNNSSYSYIIIATLKAYYVPLRYLYRHGLSVYLIQSKQIPNLNCKYFIVICIFYAIVNSE